MAMTRLLFAVLSPQSVFHVASRTRWQFVTFYGKSGADA
jgi:hypothetical protein